MGSAPSDRRRAATTRPLRSSAARIDATFAALADPTRRAVVRLLLREPLRAGELAQRVGASPPALSRHLRVLQRAGLLVPHAVEGDARVRRYALAPRALEPLRGWLDEAEALWQRQLAAFAAFAEREAGAGR